MCKFDQACPPGCTGQVDPEDPFTPGSTNYGGHHAPDVFTSVARILHNRLLASRIMRRYRDYFEEAA